MQWSLVPLKYQNTYFTSRQCSSSRFSMNLLTTPTACEMSGLVDTITYIKFPTIFSYGTRGIYYFFSVVLGLETEESLKLEANGTLTGFTLFIPKFSSIFSTYFYCDNQSLPFFMSLCISMPKICFSAPRSFISNFLES